MAGMANVDVNRDSGVLHLFFVIFIPYLVTITSR